MANCSSKNYTIKELCKAGMINQAELDILFEDKKSWYTISNGKEDWDNSKDKITEFTSAFSKVLSYMKTQKMDLRYIHFPHFDIDKYNLNDNSVIFSKCIFEGASYFAGIRLGANSQFFKTIFNGEVDFSHAIFTGYVNFNEASFAGEVFFYQSTFNGNVDFNQATFKDDVDFSETQFDHQASFKKTIFCNYANFEGATFAKKFSLYNAKIKKFNLLNTFFDDTNLLNISAYNNDLENGKVLTKDNFVNKETARLIKGHLDSHNNITESNKYFALEQELYFDELKDPNSTEPNRWQTITTLFLNKYVSHFGTDWLRSLIVLILFGYIVMIGYMAFDHIGWLVDDKDKSVIHFNLYQYLPLTLTMISGWGFLYRYTFTKDIYLILIAIPFIVLAFFIADANNLEIRTFTNYIVQITNPIGAFKDVELYKGIEFYATIVRITIAVMIYQFIVAFRNNTRRS
ncbi:MAG: pentapeptide repeat-containing protein [Sulfuricurvum sp.]|uniref:pentapeptide repeat-containing protein n=1 Tax=Sulfuricurvum sp. TaxID=2025608 RepID=UPI002732CFCD|nr:pentapeptide repeat-containing protein [Sulfuricurvum sp.]MDP2849731.1 pentapeptide repeat-containing protein [Sulfuricurvum sp.]